MKLFIKNIFLVTLLVVLYSCNESEDLVTDSALAGGKVDASSTANSYVVGNPGPYNMEFFVHQSSSAKVTSLELYKSFQGSDLFTSNLDGSDSIVAYSTNEILDKTITVSGDVADFISTAYMFDELTAGLARTDNSNALPTADGDLRIGDRFVFKVKAKLSDGRTVSQAYTISFAVSTRYAGNYRCLEGAYYRIHAPSTVSPSDWPEKTIIESVDAKTYRVVQYFGFFENTSTPPEWYFQIVDGVISYPATAPDGTAQTGNTQPFITCQTNFADFDLDGLCSGDANVVINDDIAGKDKLIMTFGYLTPGSGPRTFYQVLEKIVD